MKWITATNLEQWAGTLPARVNFPALVADLIRASAPGVASIRFPSGDKGQVRGFDGFLQATGAAPYVPEGRSIWEFGVAEAGDKKADKDYEKRTREVDEATRKQTTFVFVTPRTWNNGNCKIADWVDDKRARDEWRSVEYLDGSHVEDWLAMHPAVAARYARYELKLMPALGARSSDEFWEEYAHRFSPALVEDVVLAGREAQAKNLLQRLGEGVSRLAYAADSPDEVIAFAVAALRKAEPAVRLFLEARVLVVDTEDAARQLAGRDGLVFMPRAQARGLAGLLAQYSPTIVSAGADEKRSNHEQLARPDSSALGRALVAMGFSEQEGYERARKCGRSLAVLARQMPSGTAETPEWLTNADVLLPALLAGAWDTSKPADKAVLCSLAACDEYDSVEMPLRKLAKLKDPPVDHVGDVWAMRASVDAFVHLGHLIGPEHLRRFAATAHAVFSRLLAPPSPDELYRPPGTQDDAHSSWVRDGMMNTLLHMAVLHEQADFWVQGTTPQEYVNGIVRALPGLSSDYRLLASLQENLALLAEAAPIPFLEALERLLEGDAAAIRPIFDERPGLLSPQSLYLGVLWGLETLAWDPDLLLRSSMCLARLAEIDPGGALSNRPINSLRSIFLSWAPNTHAHAKQRVGVAAHIVRSVPSIAWPFMEKILPRPMDTSSPTAKPKFRETQKFGPEILTYAVVWESQAAFVELALACAGEDVQRWQTIISRMHQFPKEAFDKTVTALDARLGSLQAEERLTLWDSLRKEVNRHRTYANSDWALKEALLHNLDAVVEKYQPDDPLLVTTWLFDDWMPDIPEKAGQGADPMPAIERARLGALQEILERHGISGIVRLARAVKLPQQVAGMVAALQLAKEQMSTLFHESLDASGSVFPLSAVVLAEGVKRFGETWVAEARALFSERETPPSELARLLMAMEESSATWNLVRTFGPAVEEAYWREKHALFIPGSQDDLLYAIDKYMSVGRAMAAIQGGYRRLAEVPSGRLVRLLSLSIAEINATPGGGGTMTTYYIEHVFDALEIREDVQEDELAELELAYMPLLSHRGKTLTLHRQLVTNPAHFVQAICAVFNPASGPPQELSEQAKRAATAAYELLEGLQVLPGQEGNDVDFDALKAWCTEVRALAEGVDRKTIAEQRIGHLLAHGPASTVDSAWPHEAIRRVIEYLAADEVETGLEIERFNTRGAYSKAIGEGGDQERALAKQNRDWAALMPQFPRTAAMLVRIAEDWERWAERSDVNAAKQALRH